MPSVLHPQILALYPHLLIWKDSGIQEAWPNLGIPSSNLWKYSTLLEHRHGQPFLPIAAALKTMLVLGKQDVRKNIGTPVCTLFIMSPYPGLQLLKSTLDLSNALLHLRILLPKKPRGDTLMNQFFCLNHEDKAIFLGNIEVG